MSDKSGQTAKQNVYIYGKSGKICSSIQIYVLHICTYVEYVESSLW